MKFIFNVVTQSVFLYLHVVFMYWLLSFIVSQYNEMFYIYYYIILYKQDKYNGYNNIPGDLKGGILDLMKCQIETQLKY